jgi:hypothetical protein
VKAPLALLVLLTACAAMGQNPTQDACSRHDADACDDLAAEEIDVMHPNDDRVAIYRKYCELGGARSCYEAASALASAKGETADTAEDLVMFAQRACARHVPAGCNTLAHYAKDAIADCDAGVEAKDSCAAAGFVYARGVDVPPINGRSIEADATRAAAAFARSCAAGAKISCNR